MEFAASDKAFCALHSNGTKQLKNHKQESLPGDVSDVLTKLRKMVRWVKNTTVTLIILPM